MKKQEARLARRIRHRRVRRRVSGTGVRPRLSVFRSLRHIYAQIVDDSTGHTVLSVSTLDPLVKDSVDGVTKTKKAEVVGTAVAERALGKGIGRVVFDRGGCRYHGRVKALAEAARKAGLEV